MAKKTINEQQLLHIIKECVLQALNESMFEGMFEGDPARHRYGSKVYKSGQSPNKSGYNSKNSKTGDSKLRDSVEKILKSDAIDVADIAYRVLGGKNGTENEKGSKRSVFYKMIKHEPGGNGTPMKLDGKTLRKTVNALNAQGIKV